MIITARDKRLFRLALQIAEDSLCADKHGAIIAHGSRIIAVATNRIASHPKSNKYKRVSIHAEQRCIIRAKRNVSGMTLYSARYHKNTISTPCPLCNEYMQEAGIAYVVYNDGKHLRKVKV